MTKRPPSLRRQLALALAGCLTLLCLTANVAFYQYVRKLSIEEFDTALQKDLETIAAMTSVHDGGQRLELQIHNHDHPEYKDHEEAKYYHISHEDGRCHLRSRSLDAASLPKLSKVHRELVMQDITLPDGRRGRVASTLSHLHESNAGDKHLIHFALAISRDSLDRILAMQRWCAIALGAILIGTSIAIALLLTKRSFKKVDDFSTHLRAIDFDSLGNRLPDEGLPIELAPLARRFNDALARLDQGAQREIRFNANVAHELRTPVAELRAITEVGLQECQDGALENPTSYFEDASELATRMERLVDTISSLTRTVLDREQVVTERTDLVEIIARAWEPHAKRAEKRKLTASFQLPDTLLIQSDPSLVSAIATNLIINAVSHTPEGGTISISLEGSCLTIANTNDTLKPADLDHLIEPFWQKDASRTDSTHFGIGMALVDAYTRLLRIQCDFSLPREETFTVTLTFP
ncbi:MAG: signal transduction histidine kinase [Verrucomicrobiales bacterium]|jgi:signal transduction histidine kinase